MQAKAPNAENAARAVLAGEATAIPKARDGIVESIRVLRVARRSAVKARTQVANQIKDLVISAPDELNHELRYRSTKQRVTRAARLRPDATSAHPLEVTKRALRSLARRHQALTTEIRELDVDLARLTQRAAPRLLAQPGIGVEVAGQLLVTAGDNPQRLAPNAAFAALCGVSPVEASSGKITRHRVNRGGDRQANNALWTSPASASDTTPPPGPTPNDEPRTARPTRDIMRCLKRFLARQIHPLLLADLADANQLPLT